MKNIFLSNKSTNNSSGNAEILAALEELKTEITTIKTQTTSLYDRPQGTIKSIQRLRILNMGKTITINPVNLAKSIINLDSTAYGYGTNPDNPSSSYVATTNVQFASSSSIEVNGLLSNVILTLSIVEFY